MVRYTIFFILLYLFKPSVAEATGSVSEADSAYEAGDYIVATQLYKSLIEQQGASSDLYLNLGNSYYRTGQQAQSILAYERALRLDPSNRDAKFNLQFVNDRIQDDKGETGTFISNLIDNIALYYHSNTWAWIGLTLIILSVSGVAIYYFNSSILIKKFGFFGSIITIILAVMSLLLSYKALSLMKDDSCAIITSSTAMLSTVPRAPENRMEEAILLHEGTKVKILRSIEVGTDSLKQTWHEVDVDNRHRAWINDDDIEKIIP